MLGRGVVVSGASNECDGAQQSCTANEASKGLSIHTAERTAPRAPHNKTVFGFVFDLHTRWYAVASLPTPSHVTEPSSSRARRQV